MVVNNIAHTVASLCAVINVTGSHPSTARNCSCTTDASICSYIFFRMSAPSHLPDRTCCVHYAYHRPYDSI